MQVRAGFVARQHLALTTNGTNVGSGPAGTRAHGELSRHVDRTNPQVEQLLEACSLTFKRSNRSSALLPIRWQCAGRPVVGRVGVGELIRAAARPRAGRSVSFRTVDPGCLLFRIPPSMGDSRATDTSEGEHRR